MVAKFNFHHYDNLLHTRRKTDPRRRRIDKTGQEVVTLLFGAYNGDLGALTRWELLACKHTQLAFQNCMFLFPHSSQCEHQYISNTKIWGKLLYIDIITSHTFTFTIYLLIVLIFGLVLFLPKLHNIYKMLTYSINNISRSDNKVHCNI